MRPNPRKKRFSDRNEVQKTKGPFFDCRGADGDWKMPGDSPDYTLWFIVAGLVCVALITAIYLFRG